MIEDRGNSRSEARKLERRPPWGECGLVALLRGVFVIAVVVLFNAALFFTFFYQQWVEVFFWCGMRLAVKAFDHVAVLAAIRVRGYGFGVVGYFRRYVL